MDSDDLYRTATILADTVPDNAFESIRATIEYIHHSEQSLTPSNLRETAPCSISKTDSENIVYQLQVADIVSKSDLNLNQLHNAFIGAKILSNKEPKPENTLVATIPYDDRALDPSMFDSLHGELLDLIRSASESLVLMSPFLSERAYERLRPALETAAANEVQITLITNEITYGNKDFNREFTHAFLNNDYLNSQTTVYEYIDDETWTTFHAKIVIADSVRAYLGTANLTHTGLGDNLELGVIFNDNTANRLSNLMEALQKSRFLHLVKRDGTQFKRV